MKKKLIFGFLALLLIAMPLCAACEAEVTTTTATATTTTTATATVTVAPTDVYELLVNDHNPVGPPVGAIDHWAQWVEEQSGGRLDLTVIHGGALYTDAEEYEAVKNAACDISYYVVRRAQGFVLSTVITLPFLGFAEQHVEDAFWTLMDEFPEMVVEWEGVTIIGMMMMPFTHLHFAEENKVVKTPADIAGMKIFCAEATNAQIITAVGGTAVEGPIFDMTPNVQNRLCQGVFNHFPVLGVFGTLEMLHSHTVFGSGGAGINNTPMFLVMNTDVFNSLPADLQQILLDSGSIWYDKFNELDAVDLTAAMAFCEENNHTITYLTPEEVAVWRDACKAAVHDAWLAEAGAVGQEIYNRILELAAGG